MTTYPTIHLNGSDKQSLLNEYIAAADAIRDAVAAFNNIDFNARDYYVQGNDAFRAASKEIDEHFHNLKKADTYLMDVAFNISNQTR